MQYALFIRPAATIYDLPEKTRPGEDGQLLSAIGDEGLYGQSCQVVEDPDGEGMVRVCTFYGYPGYVDREDLLFLTEEQLRAYLSAPSVMAARASSRVGSITGASSRSSETARGSSVQPRMK